MDSNSQDIKKCKFCQTDIPKKATVCPNCKKDLRSWFSRHPILSVILIIFIIWMFASNSVEKQANENKIIDSAIKQNLINSWVQVNIDKLEEQVRIKNKEILNKILIVSQNIVDKYWFAHLRITLKNNTWREIDALEIKASFKDNFNKPVLASISWDSYFIWIIQEKIWSKNYTAEWQLSLFQNATKINELKITKIHFIDKDETIESE